MRGRDSHLRHLFRTCVTSFALRASPLPHLARHLCTERALGIPAPQRSHRDSGYPQRQNPNRDSNFGPGWEWWDESGTVKVRLTEDFPAETGEDLPRASVSLDEIRMVPAQRVVPSPRGSFRRRGSNCTRVAGTIFPARALSSSRFEFYPPGGHYLPRRSLSCTEVRIVLAFPAEDGVNRPHPAAVACPHSPSAPIRLLPPGPHPHPSDSCPPVPICPHPTPAPRSPSAPTRRLLPVRICPHPAPASGPLLRHSRSHPAPGGEIRIQILILLVQPAAPTNTPNTTAPPPHPATPAPLKSRARPASFLNSPEMDWRRSSHAGSTSRPAMA